MSYVMYNDNCILNQGPMKQNNVLPYKQQHQPVLQI